MTGAWRPFCDAVLLAAERLGGVYERYYTGLAATIARPVASRWCERSTASLRDMPGLLVELKALWMDLNSGGGFRPCRQGGRGYTYGLVRRTRRRTARLRAE